MQCKHIVINQSDDIQVLFCRIGVYALRGKRSCARIPALWFAAGPIALDFDPETGPAALRQFNRRKWGYSDCQAGTIRQRQDGRQPAVDLR